MKYMLMIYAAAVEADGTTPEPGDFGAWVSYHKAVQDAGIMVSSESLADLVTATTVQVDEAGARTVTDGPFTESREVLGGFYVIDVPDLDAALDWAARCPGAREGAVVVRPVAEF
ncbi:YciI family protein [Spirillospora sp. NPDC052269]